MRLFAFLTPAELDVVLFGATPAPARPRPVTPAEAIFGARVHVDPAAREDAALLFPLDTHPTGDDDSCPRP